MVLFGDQRLGRCYWGLISKKCGFCWSTTIITHPTQLWVYLVITTKYCIDATSFTFTNWRTIIGWLVFKGLALFLQVTANLLYHSSNDSLWWLSSKAKQEWKVHNFDHGWWQILKHNWHSKMPFVSKIFIWRDLIGGCLWISSKAKWTSNG